MTAEDTADAVISEARNFATDSFSSANQLVDQAVSIANTSFALRLDPMPEAPVIPVPEVDTEVPTYDQKVEITGERPDAPSLTTVNPPETPDFDNISRPEPLNLEDLFNQDQPVFDLPSIDRAAPEVSTPTIPDSPTLDIPQAPDLTELSFPNEPSTVIPAFNPQKPTSRPGEAPDAEDIMEVSYSTILPQMRENIEAHVDDFIDKHSPNHKQIMGRLESRLEEMQQGGTAMPAEVEQRLYDRARARTEGERQNTEAEAVEAAARRGHTIPPGAMQAALMDAAHQAARNNAATSSEIAIEQARLEQQNIQFAIQTSSALRQAIINAALQYSGTLVSINGQAIQYAQAVASSAIDVYNAQVNYFNAEVNYFQAQAQVYEIELRAAFAELERYQALVRVEELKSQINSQLVEQYRQQIEVQRARVQMYAEQLRAIGVQIESDRARIDAFGASVQAYSAQVQAKQAEFQVYEAALRGDEAKVRGFATQVDAYRAEIGAEAAKSETEIAQTQAVTNFNRSQVEIFRSEMQAYGVDISARSSIQQAELRNFATQLEAYRARLEGEVEKSRVHAENARLEFEQQRTQFTTDADFAIQATRLSLDRVANASQAAISGAGVYGNIAQAAVGAQNTMVSLAHETLSGE